MVLISEHNHEVATPKKENDRSGGSLQRDGVGGANDPGIAAAAALDAACPAHADGSNLFFSGGPGLT